MTLELDKALRNGVGASGLGVPRVRIVTLVVHVGHDVAVGQIVDVLLGYLRRQLIPDQGTQPVAGALLIDLLQGKVTEVLRRKLSFVLGGVPSGILCAGSRRAPGRLTLHLRHRPWWRNVRVYSRSQKRVAQLLRPLLQR